MSKILRKLVNGFERLFDVSVIRRSSGAHWPEANFERGLMQRLNIDCVFDVGANVGQYAAHLRRVIGFKGTILSFEPNPAAFKDLQRAAMSDPSWHCYPFALGAISKSDILNVTKADVFSSIRRPLQDEGRHFADSSQVEEQVEIEVYALEDCLDQLRSEFSFARAFLKLDTQGYDLEVLKGAGLSINTFVGAQSEVSFVPLYEHQPTAHESINAFRAAGLEIVDLFNVHPAFQLSPLIECNCFFLRRDLTVA